MLLAAHAAGLQGSDNCSTQKLLLGCHLLALHLTASYWGNKKATYTKGSSKPEGKVPKTYFLQVFYKSFNQLSALA